MAISPWTKPLDMKIAPLPFEALAYGYEKRQQRQDKADELLSTLDESFLKINSIPLDTPRKQELVGELQQQVYSLVDRYKGNLAEALPEIKALNRKVQYETNYGELGAIKERYNQFSTNEAKRAEAVKRYMMGEKGGMTEEEAMNARNYELTRLNKPIEKTAYGWSTYNSLPSQPHVDIETKVMEVAKEIKPESIERMTGLKYDGQGYFVNLTTGEKKLAAPYIEEVAYRSVMQDREVNDYLKFKHTVSGDLDRWSETLANSPAEGVILDTPQGQMQMDPNKWLEENFYGDVRRAARNAGNIYRQYETTIEADYKENWRERDAAKEARERQLLDFPLPAQTVPAAMQNLPEATTVNPDGTIRGGQDRPDDNFVEQWGTMLAPLGSLIRYSFAGIFDPGIRTTGQPTTKSGIAAVQAMQQDAKDLETMIAGTSKTKQQLVDEQAQQLRKDYPELAQAFPRVEKTTTNDKGQQVKYDANAGKIANFVRQSITNSQAVIGNMLTPESPTLSERIQKQYFNKNVFDRVSYSLADGKLGTKKEAQEALGFEGGVPQEVLNQAVFNGYGGFLNPGAILAQVPNSEGVPQNIVVEPDERTRRTYTHSRNASKAFLEHKPTASIEYTTDATGRQTPYYFEYKPSISPDGRYTVKIEQYTLTPDNKKGTFVESEDAMEVYAKEHTDWLQDNSFTLR